MESKDRRLATLPGVKVAKLGFSSADGETQIKALLWSPEGTTSNPKGIVQISHGMEEHLGRYVDFANYLATQGFVVCAHDMLGHGLSVTSDDKLSCLPLEGGKDILIEDAHELYKMVASRYSRQTPYFVFGHSMGSYLMRAYVTRYGEGLAGAVFCGAGQQSSLISWAGNKLARWIAQSKGEDFQSPFLDSMGVGAFSKRIEGARTEFDWLCTDSAVVDEYIADPWCGVPFSAGAYATLTDLTGEVASSASVSAVPKDLPVLFIAGMLDPVGDNGKGVERSAEHLRRAGVMQVDVKMYENLRHEILNEPAKKDVYTDVVQWIDAVIDKR